MDKKKEKSEITKEGRKEESLKERRKEEENKRVNKHGQKMKELTDPLTAVILT